MKNLKALTHKEERENFLDNLWKTPEFKEYRKRMGSWLQNIEQDFIKHPRFIAEYTNAELEHAHFYSWFNILILREYKNPIIQDLYYLHELYHMTQMPYKVSGFDEWYKKMVDNETLAAMFSEVLIYNEINIRNQSFPFPIWYDQLSPEDFKDLGKLQDKRMEAMTNPKNEVEGILHQYHVNNQTWGEVWRDNFSKIEAHMWFFYETAKNTNKDVDYEKMAVFIHQEWLRANSSDNIPFKSEAEDFADSYRALKKRTKT